MTLYVLSLVALSLNYYVICQLFNTRHILSYKAFHGQVFISGVSTHNLCSIIF